MGRMTKKSENVERFNQDTVQALPVAETDIPH